ncbi:putative naringenin-chalcone synthase [Lentzea atacamensis]|uniref:Naringenin-chalcone synthase n=1 Tax=Lentzea atacamensis TaxID=531938 RepID=A0A316HQY3_9PSEU|nr:type III polyketide synthase [Lentzea atacamensis]PWK83676.1 putative naringenin-chalcone synthase [Lentzea atacamensis]RAS70345.1 putative naringenin-chalcone synthase [Lentzea atacamensis]
MTAHIAAIGTALPPVVEQSDLWDDHFRARLNGSRAAGRIFAGAGVRRRHAVVSPLDHDVSECTTGERMRLYDQNARPLGHAAVTAALSSAGLEPAEVGQLTVVSCTGYAAPGLDVQLAASLDLAPDAQRLLVGHMGCYAALPALATVTDFVTAHRRPAVLLCLELTSLHVQPSTMDVEQIVSHALFGDAATALVVRPDEGSLQVVATSAVTDPASAGHMTWTVTDHGFRMTLSRQVPEVLGKHLRHAVERLLADNGLTVPEVRGWAVHPGGPRILDTVGHELGLPSRALEPSRHVLREHGNCSSATVVLVLDELLRSTALRPGDPVVAMAFGPGLTLYVTLFRHHLQAR